MQHNRDLFGPGVESVWKNRGSKPKKVKTGLTAGSNLPLDIRAMLGEAEGFYIRENYERATEMLSEVIKKAPKHPDAYHIMALIHEDRDSMVIALQMFMLAAQNTPSPKCYDDWSRVAELAGNRH
jgi:hypothetical protein